MRNTSIRVLLWAIAVLAISTACTNLLHKSPENVVKAFFNAANDGKYSEAEGYLASPKKVLVAVQGGIKPLADRRTRDGNIESVDIVKVETRGEGAKVYFKIRYKGGQTMDDDASLIKENGDWKIVDTAEHQI